MAIDPRMSPASHYPQVDLKRSLVADKVIDGLKLVGLYAGCATFGLVSLALAPITAAGGLLRYNGNSAGMRMLGGVMAASVLGTIASAQKITKHSDASAHLAEAKTIVDRLFTKRDSTDFTQLKSQIGSLSSLLRAELGAYI